MNRSADSIALDLNYMNSSSDFTNVSQEIQALRYEGNPKMKSDLARINSEVDFTRLGFAEDFQILGVNESGQMMTLSQDGGRLQYRDASHLNLMWDAPNINAQQPISPDRDVTCSADGNATYTVKPGDNLWSISKDVLSHQLGREPNAQEITASYKELAQLNGIQNPDLIQVGQELKLPSSSSACGPEPNTEWPCENPHLMPGVNPFSIPDPTLPQYSPGEACGIPNLSLDSPQLAPLGNIYRPMAPMGLEGDAYKNGSVVRTESVIPGAGGFTSTNYDGNLLKHLQGAHMGVTQVLNHFDGQVNRDARGMIVSSFMQYQGDGATMSFDRGDGDFEKLQNVQSVRTNFDSQRGQYVTHILTASGKYVACTDANGVVRSFAPEIE